MHEGWHSIKPLEPFLERRKVWWEPQPTLRPQQHFLLSVGITPINVPQQLITSQGASLLERLFTLEKACLGASCDSSLTANMSLRGEQFVPGLNESQPFFLETFIKLRAPVLNCTGWVGEGEIALHDEYVKAS